MAVDGDSRHVTWKHLEVADDWLRGQPIEKWKHDFNENGFLVVNNLIGAEDIQIYRDIYDKMMKGDIDTASHRHDLGNHTDKKVNNVENILQIMWPSIYVADLDKGPIHQRSKLVAQSLLGTDIEFDFDMLIAKAPHTDTCTPWHQDESYWPKLPDNRATSCWVALDNATVDNGCMWFVPGCHKIPIRPHRPAKVGCHVLTCDVDENEGRPFPIPAGSCTFHHGRMLHYTRGNSTDAMRRAYICNYRPAAMIEMERSMGYDHGKKGVHDIVAKSGQTHSE